MPKQHHSQGKRIQEVVFHKKLSNRWKKEVFHFREAAAIYAQRNGITAAQIAFQKNYTWVQYWKKKREDSTFHSGNWGGARIHKWTEEQIELMWEILWNKCKNEPTSTIPE